MLFNKIALILHEKTISTIQLKPEASSYKQIIKSTSIYGTSQLVNIVLGVVRSKLTAVLLGTAGIGVIGLLQSVIDLSRAGTGLGLDVGATKKIATKEQLDEREVGKSLYTVNLWYLFTALLGGVFCIVFAKSLSLWAFESEDYTLQIVGLSLAVLFIALTAGIVSSLQGLRKITYMAYASSVGSFLSLLVMIPIYYYWRVDGIVPMYILTNLVMLLVAIYFYRKVEVKPIRIPTKEVLKRGKGMVRLGLFIVLAGVLSTASLLAVRAHLNREMGLDSVGLFHAAWIITALMWGIVLRSTNSEFFPKLCAIVGDRKATKKFVNEQTYIVLLIISPIIIAMLTFSDYVLDILYTSEFIGANTTLRWHLVGAFFKIAATPIATIMLAKNRGALHLACEASFWIVYLVAFYLLFPSMQLVAAGLAYFIAYVVYIPVVLFASYRTAHVLWATNIVVMLLVNVGFMSLMYISIQHHFLNSMLMGLCILALTLCYALWKLKAVLSFDTVLKYFKRRK